MDFAMTFWLRTAVVLSIALLAGCGPKGPPVAIVKGKVTSGGKPLTSGIIFYQSENGLLALTAEINAQGEYQMKTYDSAGLPPGKYKVAVKPAAANPTGMPPLAGEALTAVPVVDKSIPARYYGVETSGLTADVTLEAKSHDFDLKP